MYHHTYVRFMILFAIVDLGIISRAHNWCAVNETHMEECNHCWCVDPGVPVCTKMDCTKVLESLKEETEGEGKRSVGLAIVATGILSWAAGELFRQVRSYAEEIWG